MDMRVQALLTEELCMTATLIASHTFNLLLQTVYGGRKLDRGVISFPENVATYDWSFQVAE